MQYVLCMSELLFTFLVCESPFETSLRCPLKRDFCLKGVISYNYGVNAWSGEWCLFNMGVCLIWVSVKRGSTVR